MRANDIEPPGSKDRLRDLVDGVSSFILANLLWVFCSIPVVTMPTATAGLFATMSAWQREGRPEVLNVFFDGMRQNWRKATLIGVIDAVVVALVVMNALIFPFMDIASPITFLSRSMTIFVIVVLIMFNLYVWALLVVFDMPLLKLLRTALGIAFGNPLYTLGLMILALLPLAASLVLPYAVLIVCAFAVVAYIVNWGAWRRIRRYVQPEALSRLEWRTGQQTNGE